MRTDPLVINDKLGDERSEPDRPGQFPIMSARDLLDVRNPLFEEHKKKDLFAKNFLRDPAGLSSEGRQQLDDFLTEHFGTPRAPIVKGLAQEHASLLQLSSDKLEPGRDLYRVHCIHCHGVTGDGRGPTAKWINPHPRDFRRGIFKFQSVDQAIDGRDRYPSRADLVRTLQQGIEGTAMPTFNLLSHEELESLVSYVIHLSIRGKVEHDILKEGFSCDPKTGQMSIGQPVKDFASEYDLVADQGKKWAEAQKKPIEVAPYPFKLGDHAELIVSMKRGKQLFLAEGTGEASCVSCHVDLGRRANWKFDSWGTLVRPSNLTTGMYRGGRRPVDIYYRIHSGINGSGMPRFGKLEPQKLWDLVNFVQALPYPAMRKELGLD